MNTTEYTFEKEQRSQGIIPARIKLPDGTFVPQNGLIPLSEVGIKNYENIKLYFLKAMVWFAFIESGDDEPKYRITAFDQNKALIRVYSCEIAGEMEGMYESLTRDIGTAPDDWA